MSKRQYQVQELASLAGVTVRTLHYYDEIGLLKPSSRSAAGYRRYGESDLLLLQQILVCRELGLPLEQIKRMVQDRDYDRRKMLLEHRAMLEKRLDQTEKMIRAVDHALQALDGGITMDPKQTFDGFDAARYEAEVKKRWGNTDAYREAARRTRGYSPEDWRRIKSENNELLANMAACLAAGEEPTAQQPVELAERLRQHIDRWYYPCNRHTHAALAEMYVQDERFKASFERHAEGLAAFVAAAIQANAQGSDGVESK